MTTSMLEQIAANGNNPFSADQKKDTINFFTALGFDQSDTVFFNLIFNHKPLENDYSFDSIDYEYLNNCDRNIYAIVNKAKGKLIADVKKARNFYFEFDNLSFERQWALIKELPLHPSMIVNTGGKSFHCYYFSDKNYKPDDWFPQQRGLTKFVENLAGVKPDTSLNSINQIMRVPGFTHPKSGKLTHIVELSGTFYSKEQLKNAFGLYEKINPIIQAGDLTNEIASLATGDEGSTELRRLMQNVAALEGVEMTLYEGLDIEVRKVCEGKESSLYDQTKSGNSYLISEGNRHDVSFKVGGRVLRLIAIYDYLGIKYDQEKDAKYIFDKLTDFYDGEISHEKLEKCRHEFFIRPSEAGISYNDKILSADFKNINSVIKAKYKSELKKVKLANRQISGAGGSNNGSSSPPAPDSSRELEELLDGVEPADEGVTHDEIVEIIKNSLNSDEPDIAIALLKQKINPYTVDSIVKALEKKEQDENSLTQAFERLSKYELESLDVSKIFYGDNGEFANQLNQLAKNMSYRVEPLVTTLQPVLASQLGTRHILNINKSSDFTSILIYWSIVVGHSGDKKSPAQKVILKALVNKEHEAFTKYQEEMSLYQAAMQMNRNSDEEMPKAKQYITSDTTPQALYQVHSENPTGILIHKDEASAFVNELGRFINTKSSGGGGEKEQMLKEFNGDYLKINRKTSASIYMPRTAISRTGTTQWATLADQMGDHNDLDGWWARFRYCAVHVEKSKFDCSAELPPTKVPHTISRLLALFTEWNEKLDEGEDYEYTLSKGSKNLVNKYVQTLIDAGYDSDENSEKSAYPKFQTYFFRDCLFIHIVNNGLKIINNIDTAKSVKDGVNKQLEYVEPNLVIDEHAVRAAIMLNDFFIHQYQLIMDYNNPNREVTGNLRRLLDYVNKKKSVSLTVINKNGVLRKQGVKKAEYVKLLDTLIEMGKIDKVKDLYMSK